MNNKNQPMKSSISHVEIARNFVKFHQFFWDKFLNENFIFF